VVLIQVEAHGVAYNHVRIIICVLSAVVVCVHVCIKATRRLGAVDGMHHAHVICSPGEALEVTLL
jgi:hypothetical protein